MGSWRAKVGGPRVPIRETNTPECDPTERSAPHRSDGSARSHTPPHGPPALDGRDHAWCRPLPFTFIYNRHGASLRKRCRQRLKAWRWLNGEDWGIGEREWLGYAHHISDGVDGGHGFQHRQKDIFGQAGIGQRTMFSSSRSFQPNRYIFETMARPCGIAPACPLECVTSGMVGEEDGTGGANELDAAGRTWAIVYLLLRDNRAILRRRRLSRSSCAGKLSS